MACDSAHQMVNMLTTARYRISYHPQCPETMVSHNKTQPSLAKQRLICKAALNFSHLVNTVGINMFNSFNRQQQVTCMC